MMSRAEGNPSLIQTAGVYQLPEWSVEDVGGTFEITLGFGLVSFNIDVEQRMMPIVMRVPGTTFALPHNEVSIIFAHYSPELGPTFQISPAAQPHEILDHAIGIPVLQCFPYTPLGVPSPLISVIDFDTPARIPHEKLFRRISDTDRIRLESYAFGVSESATRIVSVDGGVAYMEVNRIVHEPVASNTGVAYDVYFNAGQIVHEPMTQYNNLYYSSGSGKVAVNPNQFCINWIFRSVRQSSSVILSLMHTRGGIGTLSDALDEPFPTDIPEPLRRATAFVGRIIVQQASNTAARITQWWDIPHQGG